MNWIEKKVKIKKEKVVVKLYDEDERFVKSVITPTILYPLFPGKIKVFKHDNTELITDENLKGLIDKVQYNIGKCFDNCSRLSKLLLKNGYEVKPYAGWLFLENETPVWHSWLVINDNQIIDLSNTNNKYDADNVARLNKYHEMTAEEKEDFKLFYFRKILEISNSQRCLLGKASERFLYVGSECDPESSYNFYNRLLIQFPNHESYSNCDKSTGLNKTQTLLEKNGLLNRG